jgi:hypothetical protein
MMNRLHLPGALALCFSATLVAQKPIDASFKADGSVKIADTSNRNALPPVMPLSESVTVDFDR